MEIPFNSSNKWQMSVHNMKEEGLGGKQLLLLKGAPDVLLSKCSHYLKEVDGVPVMHPVDTTFTEMYTSAYEDFGGQVRRKGCARSGRIAQARLLVCRYRRHRAGRASARIRNASDAEVGGG